MVRGRRQSKLYILRTFLTVNFFQISPPSAGCFSPAAQHQQQQCAATAAPPWEDVALTSKYNYKCDLDPFSLRQDLDQYPAISSADVDRAEQLYGQHARRLIIKDNVLYARDGSKKAIVGVSAFVEDMLLLLLQRVKVPDCDFVLNCSDYPQVRRTDKNDAPLVSMCGSTRHRDIIVPTYTLSHLVTGRTHPHVEAEKPWDERKDQMVWRGTDSNRDRFKFNLIANSPEFAATSLLDVGINKMVRVPHDPAVHGPVRPAIPQREFGEYKWIANVDGAVAAYRMPAVAALGSAVVMQESHYLEHWYRELVPYKHYVPMKKDFSDLEDVLDWLQTHDEEAKQIGATAREFALENLTAEPIQCFWYVFLYEYTARMTFEPVVLEGMEVSTGSKQA